MKLRGISAFLIILFLSITLTAQEHKYLRYNSESGEVSVYKQNQDQLYIDKITKLAGKVRSDISQYFIDKETQKDLNLIKSIEEKHKE